MNFKITHKHREEWNKTLSFLYEHTPYPINEIFWRLEQLRTPKEYDWDIEILNKMYNY